VLGEAVKANRGWGSIATKVSPGHERCRDVLKAAGQCLLQMKMDYDHLYQLQGPNPAIPVEEIMGAAQDVGENPVYQGQLFHTA
jgi:diketogulonate reductase-like aldo/keto reductase